MDRRRTHILKLIKQSTAVFLLLYIIVPFQYFQFLPIISTVEAATNTLTSRADFNTGTYIGTEAKTKEGEIKLQGDGTWNARAWKTPNLVLNDQSAIVSDGSYIYLRPAGDNEFTRFLPSENRWQALSNAPLYSFPGADMVYLNGVIYSSFGGYQKEFKKYTVGTNTWSDLADMPDLTYAGSALVTDGTYIYAFRGSNTTDFWRYNVATDRWSVINSPPATIGAGGSLSYSGGYLYATRGASTQTFYRYDIGAGTWSTMTNVPATIADDTSMDINGNFIYLSRGQATTTLYRYSISGNSWATLAALPQASRYVGNVYNADDGYMYIFRGNGTQDFWKYNIGGDNFIGPTDLPAAPGTGADLINVGTNLFYLRGNTSTALYKLDTTTNTWSALLAAAPATFADDTKGASAGATLYFMRGSNTQTFYSYDTAGNSWTTLTNTPATVGAGGALAYPATGNYIYATRGNNTTGFWRYNISGNSWDDAGAADLPATNATAYIGARLISDGTDVYYMAGNGVTQLLKYTVGSNTWSVVGSLPFSPYYGADMSYSAGKIYFQSGLYKPNFWEYTISGGTWRRLPDIETTFATEQGPYNGGALENNGGGTFYTISGQNITYMHSFTRSAYNYPASGTWTSGAIDLTYVTSWTSLTSSVTTPGDSSVTFETRTSSDRVSWTSWVSVSGGTISSAANRYIQVRATLNATSDKTQTPTLSSVSVNYSGDTSSPTNPISITAKSQSVAGVTLTNSTSYSYTNPYFSWSGAADADTSVAGYYVYFGTSSSADPAVLGNYQTGNTYTVTTPLSNNTYYLRIKTKDSGGNTSSAATLFTYIYGGITAQAVTATSTSDFATGTLTNVSNSSNQLQLSSKAGFWLQQRLSLAPATISNGAGWGYVSSTNKLYTFRGGTTNTFYEYDVATDTWTTKANAPATVTTGGAMAGGPSGYIYALRGSSTNSFWRYDINANTWDDAAAADAPQIIGTGSSLFYDGSRYIYALAGNNDDAFYQYDTTTDTWSALANTNFGAPTLQPTNVISAGGDMAYDGNDTIYVIQGSVTGSGYYNTGFATYTISTGTWTQLTNLPATPTADGAQIEFDSTSNAVYYIPANGKVALYKYDLSSSAWSQLSDGPATIGAGAAMKNIGGILYILRGNGQQQLYTYNITKASWQVPTMGLFSGLYRGSDVRTFTTGAQIIKGNGTYYYLTRGSVDDMFVRYDSSNGEVVQLTNIPAGMTTGSHFAYDSVNSKIYAIANGVLQKMYVYDIATDVWTELSSDVLPALPGAGASLEYDGSRYIYYVRGGSTTALYRYDTQASAGSRWSALLAAAPGTIGAGGSAVYKGSYLYVTRGNTSVSFYRYDPSGNTWSDPAVADFAATNNFAADGFIVDGGGDYIYGCRANNTSTCYQYSVSGNTWTQIANAPANITAGGSGAGNKSDRFYVIAGAGTNTFTDGLYTYIEQTSTSSFQETGTFQSATHDLSSVYKFANISLSYTSASNASFVVSTRTSADNSTFSSWSNTTEEKVVGSTYTYKINSAVNRYIQVKITLSSGDGIYASSVGDYTINYYQDTTPPANPSSISSYSTSTQSASITTNTWYNHSAPYFSWPAEGVAGGASDGASGSGISGYYVYFGTNSSADPQTDGALQTTTTYTASGLVSASTYYLRIKAVDNANNVVATTWQPFIYKYDSEAPTNPTTIIADPPGYSNVNSFNFSWSGATDSGSLVSQYCYKTGASGSSETCTSATSISGIAAYQSGANAFYVRARDNAGNLTSTYATASYYYSSTAPSAPTNLEVSPATNTVNQFSFTWNPPANYSGSQAGLRYYYSINALPTSSNVNAIGLTTTYLTSGSYATQPGKNTLYVVAKDEAGNIDYNVYGSVDFTADTSSPGIPRNMDIADVSTKSTSEWKLAISWNAPEASGSGVASYKVYQSTTVDASCSTGLTGFTNVASTTGTSYVDADITQSTHYYCVKACDSTNNCSAASDTVSLYPDGKWTTPPDLIGSPAVDVKTKSGIVSWSTSRTSNSFVKYGTKSGDYGAEVGSSDQLTSHKITLTGLNPGTKYYYKVLWTDEDGNSGESSEQTFTTEAAPFISSVKITDISLYSAYVNFAINHTSSVKIEYGKTVNYGSVETLSTSTSEITQSVKLEDLVEGTIYHLRITAEDAEGNTFAGDDYTFETLPVPKVVGLKVQQVVGLPTATLRLVWSSNTLLSSIVTYYPSASPEKTKDQISLVLKKNHEIILKNLSDETEYTIVVKGKDAGGNEAVSPVQKVKTATDVRPPEIQNSNIETTVAGVGDGAKAQIIASWDTDEPSSTQIEYGEGTGTTYGSSTQEDPNLTTNHSVTIPSLLPSKIYHLRIVSKDKSKNIGYSEDIVIITPNATKDALNLVINKLSKTFGFLKSTKLLK
jgi:N-acetylneuraminic acid mutarotase